MKYRRRYRLNWTVLSPLHLGAGKADIRAQEGEDPSEVALITRDHAGKPWIPGSSIKGALGAACTDAKVRLFGKAHEKGSDQARGVLTFSGARYVNKVGSDASITISQTSVAAGTGVAAANKLYRREFVPEGVGFTSEIDVEGRDKAQVQADSAALEALLALAVAPEGMQLGANKADDLGRLQITEVSIADSSFGPTGWTPQTFAPHSITAAAPARAALVNLRMVCPGPFISKGGQTDNETLPLMDAAKKSPRVMGTAVSGALRKRAEWLWALHLHRGGAVALKSCKTSAGPKDLDPVQRLFGYEGRRGLLRIEPRNVLSGGPCHIPGVSLDGMTAAPRRMPRSAKTPSGTQSEKAKGLLFFYKADHGVSFDLSITNRAALDPAETALFALIEADLRTNGLKLGMGTTKGFGWFMCQDDPWLSKVSQVVSEPLKKLGNSDLATKYRDTLPSADVKIPYRLTYVDPTAITMPEADVSAACEARALLSQPMAGAASGFIDLVWYIETPVLVAAETYPFNRPPTGIPFQNIKQRYVIPGSTFKGMLRAEMERRVNARAYKILDHLLAVTEDRSQREPHFKVRQRRRAFAAHDPATNGAYRPDFVEALCGYVREPSVDDAGPEIHEALHLKSRISFGTGWLVSGFDKARSRELYRIEAAEPKLVAKFYDHIGRKGYLVDSCSADTVAQRLERVEQPKDKKSSTAFRLLHPEEDMNLLFRQRLYLHNMTAAEIGALLSVLTLDFNLRGRHMIGRARAFGAGRCFAAQIDMHLDPHDPGVTLQIRQDGDADKRMIGQSAEMFRQAFVDFLNGGDVHYRQAMEFAAQEFAVAHDPLFGDLLRKRQGLRSSDICYQQTTDHSENITLPKDVRIAACKENNGRLAAMLKKTWSS